MDDAEQLLKRYASGDVALRGEIVRRLMPLADRLASGFGTSSDDVEDLRQVAYAGLLGAIDRFDPRLGPFVPFAIVTVRGELQRHVREDHWPVRLPRSLQEGQQVMRASRSGLQASSGRAPSPEELATATGLSLEQVLDVLRSETALAVPLDDQRDGDGRTLGEVIGEEDPKFLEADGRHGIARAMEALTDRQRALLVMRFREGLSQSEIAARLGISQPRVSQLLSKTVAALRDASGADEPA